MSPLNPLFFNISVNSPEYMTEIIKLKKALRLVRSQSFSLKG